MTPAGATVTEISIGGPNEATIFPVTEAGA